MTSENQNENDRFSADPKIRELRARIEEAKKREEIARAVSDTKNIPPSETDKENSVQAEPTTVISALRTYESDAAKAIKSNKSSLASIQIAETESKHTVKKSIGTAGHALSVYISIVLIALGISALAVIYYLNQHKTAPPPVVQTDSIISAEVTKMVDISGLSAENIIDAVNQAEESGASPLSITKLVLEKKTAGIASKISAGGFMNSVASRAPGSLVRSLKPDFAIGFYNGATSAPFIIFQVDSYENAYAGMLAWEETLGVELGGFVAKQNGAMQGNFSDEVVTNKDTRKISDQNGVTQIIYSFIDKNTILITTNEKSFSAILNKIIASKFVR